MKRTAPNMAAFLELPQEVVTRAWPLAWFKRPTEIPRPPDHIRNAPIKPIPEDVEPKKLAEALKLLGFPPGEAQKMSRPTKDVLATKGRKWKRQRKHGDKNE